MAGFLHKHAELPEGVLLSVEGRPKAEPRPRRQPPRWLARLLPGVQWSATVTPDTDEDVDDDEDLDSPETLGQRATLKEVSFTVSAGEGIALVGDNDATKTLLKLL